jgi:hypothetical protein
VRVRHGTEGKPLRDAFAQRFGKAVGISTDDDNFASATVALFSKPAGEGGGIKRLATSVEKKRGCGAVGVEVLQGGV